MLDRNYQILDYRINQSFKNKVLPKRSYSKYHQPHKYVSAMRSKTSTLRQTADASASNAKDSKPATDESSYIYRPGVTPLCRQMFYQVLFNFHHSILLILKVISLRHPNFASIAICAFRRLKSF